MKRLAGPVGGAFLRSGPFSADSEVGKATFACSEAGALPWASAAMAGFGGKIMRSFVAAGVLACLMASSAYAAEFAARYDVKGESPGGGGEYEGVVTVKKTGDATYQVVWTIGPDKFVGTGIGGPDGLAVGYKSGSNTGIAIYSVEKGGVVGGYWTYAGGKQVGTETWTPR
ncbi:MAG TPA: hypothetical protein VM780_07995 [Hansschlegelia sp.]|nr:hypothetical protein [Hansschlegelia sp.]